MALQTDAATATEAALDTSCFRAVIMGSSVSPSAVLGAAAGAGAALCVAVTVVVVRYYAARRRGKAWSELELTLEKRSAKAEARRRASAALAPPEALPVAAEQRCVQPTLAHQSKSYPLGPPRLARAPSVTSQSSLDAATPTKSTRAPSPQIRTWTPEGGPRTPSPGSSARRAAALDPRCASPSSAASIAAAACAGGAGSLRTPSPSQTSLASLAGAGVTIASPGGSPASPRCPSPLLLLPPPSAAAGATVVSSPRFGDAPSSPAPPASPLGALQPALYARRDAPLFLGGGGRALSLGRLHLRLKYDFDRSDLHVHLIEAHDLRGSDEGGFSDPYVRVSLLPGVDSRKRQTSVHRNEVNPFFDEHFKFPVTHEELQAKELLLQVFDYDRFSRNDIIGEVRITMEELDVTSSVEIWGEVTKSKKPPEEVQEVLLSLSYLPSAERLTVVLLKARNLFAPQEKETIDPFVKVYLLSGGKRVKKKKTAARKGNNNPVWNEALSFNVAASSLSQAAIEICVLDQGSDLIGHNPLLGCCVVGPQEEGAEREHWSDMTQSPRKAVAMWHTLR